MTLCVHACVCVRACVRACMRACMRACVCVSSSSPSGSFSSSPLSFSSVSRCPSSAALQTGEKQWSGLLFGYLVPLHCERSIHLPLGGQCRARKLWSRENAAVPLRSYAHVALQGTPASSETTMITSPSPLSCPSFIPFYPYLYPPLCPSLFLSVSPSLSHSPSPSFLPPLFLSPSLYVSLSLLSPYLVLSPPFLFFRLWGKVVMRDGDVSRDEFQDSAFHALIGPLQFCAVSLILTRQ